MGVWFCCLAVGVYLFDFRLVANLLPCFRIENREKVGHKAFTCYVPHFTLIADTSKPLNAYLEAS